MVMKKLILIIPFIAFAVFSTTNLVKAQSVNLFDEKTLNCRNWMTRQKVIPAFKSEVILTE